MCNLAIPDFFSESNLSRGPNDIEILVGTTKRQSGGKYYKVEEVIRHEKHDNPRRAHDVALIRLKTPIEFSDQVQPIKVSAKKVEQGENLLLSGFGSPKVSIYFTLDHTEKSKKQKIYQINFRSQGSQTHKICKL